MKLIRTFVAASLLTTGAFAQQRTIESDAAHPNVQELKVYHDVSPRLDKIPVVPDRGPHWKHENPKLPANTNPIVGKAIPWSPIAADTTAPSIAPSPFGQFTNTLLNFVGVGNENYFITGTPPDTTGAIGKTQYVQWVNSAFAVFDKTTGAMVGGVKNGNTLWSGFSAGGDTTCATYNQGDPLVQYDQMSDRWIMSQFAFKLTCATTCTPTKPFWQCVAVSQTGDANGAYDRYAVQSVVSGNDNVFNDYGKLGVWPDGYYFTVNQFDYNNSGNFSGAGLYVFDRAAMLGTAARSVTARYINLGASYAGLLPADLEGSTQPASGTPEYLFSFGTNSLLLWKWHLDWTNSANDTISSPPTAMSVATFGKACSGGTCIPQSGTTQQLDSLGDRLMYRAAYRQFSDHHSLVVSQSVNPSTEGISGAGVSGVRYYELRHLDTTPTVYQAATYAPADGVSRWMPSVAINKSGDIAAVYSASSSSINPDIRFTGRTALESLNAMQSASEQTVALPSKGSQTGVNRWGDYSMVDVDPVDECTFWGTTEYYKTSASQAAWSTRVFSFAGPSCQSCVPSVPINVVGTPGTNQATITWSAGATAGASYNVYRSLSSCPDANFSKIATCPGSAGCSGSTTYVDNSVSSGTYYYSISAVSASNCESAGTSCVSVVPVSTGCTTKPTFSGGVTGIAAAQISGGGNCGIRVSWNTATSGCPTNPQIVYNLYGSPTTPFTPSSSNRIASCLTTTSYNDVSLSASTTRYYIVRAEDSTVGNSGSCANGNEDTNTTVASATSAASCGTMPAELLAFNATGTNGTITLQILTPSSWATAKSVAIRYSTITYPTGPTSGTLLNTYSLNGNTSYTITVGGAPNGTMLYFAAYSTDTTTSTTTGGRLAKASGMDTTGNIKWTYFTTASSLTAPGVGSTPIFVSNDRVLHAATVSAGVWPTTPSVYAPFSMNAPSQARPSVPTVTISGTPTKVVYLGSQDGNVYCVNANSGNQIWKTSSALAPAGSLIQAAPTGMFTTYGGAFDILIAATRNAASANVVYGRNPATGAAMWSFDNGGGSDSTKAIGIISGDPWIDYTNKRVYFTSRSKTGGSSGSVWCLNFTSSTASLCSGYPISAGDIDGSVTLYNGKLYVGTNDSRVLVYTASTGGSLWSFNASDGPVKGFVTPDFSGATARLYFATSSKLWSLTDNGASSSTNWSGAISTISSPSIPLFTGNALYIGSGDGKLYELTSLTAATPTIKSITLGPVTSAVGSPSIDFANSRIYVGNDAGAVYGLTFPLP